MDDAELIALLRERGRPALLAELKTRGLSLPDRQKLASALAKREREATLPARAPCPPCALQPATSSNCATFEWRLGKWVATSGDAVPESVSSIIVLDDILTRDECRQFSSRAEHTGFVASKHQGVRDEGFRRGGRAALTDGGLAAEIFARIERSLPRFVGRPWASVEERQWAPAGVWEQLRVLSYDNPDDFFLPHRDNACGLGHSSLLPDAKSFYSLLLYLTDSEDGGGATRFYCEERETTSTDAPAHSGVTTTGGNAADDAPECAGRAEGGATGDGVAEAQEQANARSTGSIVAGRDSWSAAKRPTHGTAVDVVPWAGRAVVFPHRMLHESMPIVKGCKRVVRGDVLFRPAATAAPAVEAISLTLS